MAPPELPSSPLIHIGYHKTGSTWLQAHEFTAGNGWWPCFDRWRARQALSARVTSFAWREHDVRDDLRRALSPRERDDLVPVYSEEDLSGDPFTGRQTARPICDLLASVFPGATVLVVVREQRSMIRSLYSQYLRMGGAQSIDQFLAEWWSAPGRPIWQRTRAPSAFTAGELAYDELVDYYRERFGNGVRVLCFETMVRDPAGFVSAIRDIVGLPAPAAPVSSGENVSPGFALQRLERRVNWLTWQQHLNPAPLWDEPRVARRVTGLVHRLAAGLPGAERRASEEIAARIDRFCIGRYGESNAALAEATGLDLAGLGYDVSQG